MNLTRTIPLGVVPAWHDDAACDGLGDAMFPDKGDHAASSYAKRVCAGCPVRHQCLEDALDRNDQWGIRGGADPSERRALLKHRDRETAHQGQRPGPGDHHRTIAAMLARPTPATWAEIGAAIGFSGSTVKKYWHRQRHAAAEQGAAA
ncbi:WhiB family transcriptional regulator [Micromonospora costi]|uniref:WhiB family transcriptional regulator n=1 Tax=Micromonospora costi TaxID=1530042 RepID=UPI0033F39552